MGALLVKVRSNVPDVRPAFGAVNVGRDFKRPTTDAATEVLWSGAKLLGDLLQVHPQAVPLGQE